MTPRPRPRPYDRLKRLLDILGALVGLVVSLPLLLGVATAVALNLGRPVLFVQERPGLGGTEFRLLKFRSMRAVDESAGVVSDEDRLTGFGRALRSTSLDELPSLWNVLRGDMSFVGPRPLLVSYLSRYSTEQARRHEVRPGMTGLAQVRGRNTLPWDEKLRMDVVYVDSRSFACDARILWRTAATVIGHRGISADGHATTAEFMGEAVGDAER